ncbi:MAG: DUF2341 domain-containing protein [Candidatus Omnitrophota bacterium]
MRRLILTAIFLTVFLTHDAQRAARSAYAGSDKAALVSAVTYRSDGAGACTFKKNGKISGAKINKDGAIECSGSSGSYELSTPIVTDDMVCGITANWSFTGRVTLEVSATGSKKDYVPVVNGVPLEWGKFTAGSNIIWRAALGPGSTLENVKITYMDLSGVLGTWGNPELSGFARRLPIYITNTENRTPKTDLFNYQMRIRVGESKGAKDCDVYLTGAVRADFADVRFTNADKETLLPYYTEGITGRSPNRAADFWVKIPQIPFNDNIIIYLYYGKSGAKSLSDADAVFDFFDDFDGEGLEDWKWTAESDNEEAVIQIADSDIRLYGARIISAAYELADGILEYKAKSTGGAIAGIARAGKSGKTDIGRVGYSSTAGGAEHCVAVGNKVKVNDPRAILLNTFYNYRITANGKEITFQRYNADWSTQESEVKYQDTGEASKGPIGLYTGREGQGIYCGWIRARQFAAAPPVINTEMTGKAGEEEPNIGDFQDTAVAPDGGLILADKAKEGSYVSPVIHSLFKARIIVPSWAENTNPQTDNRTPKTAIAVDISAKDDGVFKKDCENKKFYYASRKDFAEGDELRWRVRFSQTENRTPQTGEGLPSLTRFTMDFRDGMISVISPNGKERIGAGTTRSIAWDASGYDPSYKMSISYSRDGGRNYSAISAAEANSGRYLWKAPADLTDKALIRVADSFNDNIYDVSNAYFSIVEGPGDTLNLGAGDTLTAESAAGTSEAEAPAQAAAEEKQAEQEKPLTKGSYELLIKVTEEKAADRKRGKAKAVPTAGGYEEGDIVMIKPAGFLWGAEEKKKFLIIQANLTDKEAKELMMPGKGRKRKFKVDLAKQGLLDAKVAALAGMLSAKPVIKREAVEEKK